MATEEVPEIPFQKGISVVMHYNDEYMSINTQGFFDDLDARDIGVESLLFTFPIFQDGANATTVYQDPVLTPSMENIRIFVSEAHNRGYTIWLKPIISESRLDGRWRGAIEPGGNLSDLNALDEWFNSYTGILIEYAILAQELDVLGLVIGTELISLDKDLPKYTVRWESLIDSARAVYDGYLSYAMNWNPQTLVGFASSLDILMIDAFYNLSGLSNYASEEEILRAWLRWENTIRNFQQLGLPIMFAEVGLVPQVGAYREPWNSNNGNPVDFEAQARYYSATCSFVDEVGIDGVFWWAIDFYDHMENQFENIVLGGNVGFTFYDLPAQDSVRDCYARID